MFLLTGTLILLSILILLIVVNTTNYTEHSSSAPTHSCWNSSSWLKGSHWHASTSKVLRKSLRGPIFIRHLCVYIYKKDKYVANPVVFLDTELSPPSWAWSKSHNLSVTLVLLRAAGLGQLLRPLVFPLYQLLWLQQDQKSPQLSVPGRAASQLVLSLLLLFSGSCFWSILCISSSLKLSYSWKWVSWSCWVDKLSTSCIPVLLKALTSASETWIWEEGRELKVFIPSFPASFTLHLTENAADAVPRHGKGLGGDGNKECSAGNADPGTLWLSQCSHHGISRAEMDLIKSCSRKAGSKLCLFGRCHWFAAWLILWDKPYFLPCTLGGAELRSFPCVHVDVLHLSSGQGWFLLRW